MEFYDAFGFLFLVTVDLLCKLVRDTSVFVRLRPAWEDLSSYLTAKGRKHFEVCVCSCTMVERYYVLEMWRLLDPGLSLISAKQLHDCVICVKLGNYLFDLVDFFLDKMALFVVTEHDAQLWVAYASKDGDGDRITTRELIDEMSDDPIVVMWSSFLGFCKVYDEIELGREAANILFKLDLHNAAAYVAIVHIYAKAGLWDEIERIIKLMKRRGIRKSTSWSWVEVEIRFICFLLEMLITKIGKKYME
ncbi:hypothetical protein ACFE04_027875 [Oxalis oulophora]